MTSPTLHRHAPRDGRPATATATATAATAAAAAAAAAAGRNSGPPAAHVAVGLAGLAGLALVAAGCAATGPQTAAASGPAGLPAAVDLRPEFERLGLTPKSQAPRGCCSLFATVALVEFELAREAPAGAPVRLSEEYLNWASHHASGRHSDGSFFSDALTGMATFGICRQDLMPYAQAFDPHAMPAAAALADADARRRVTVTWIKPWDVTTGMTDAMLEAVCRSLADGRPVAIGMRWPEREEYGPGVVLGVPPPERVFDGHSVTVVGYRRDPAAPGGGLFRFRNSFGSTWGDGGYAWLPFAYVQAYGNDAMTLRLGDGTPLPCNRLARAPLEFEALPVAATTDCHARLQAMTNWGAARWSGGAHLFCDAAAGGALTVTVTPPAAGRCRLGLFATAAPDFGTVRVFLDDRPLGQEIDLYAPEVRPTGRLDLGPVELAPGAHRLRVEVVGHNPAATGTRFGLDCLELVADPGPAG